MATRVLSTLLVPRDPIQSNHELRWTCREVPLGTEGLEWPYSQTLDCQHQHKQSNLKTLLQLSSYNFGSIKPSILKFSKHQSINSEILKASKHQFFGYNLLYYILIIYWTSTLSVLRDQLKADKLRKKVTILGATFFSSIWKW